MAAQCRSPRCTAQRKGFRRELDSWRHRLIHCVGFESILEGLYGPGLRRDLSLFDDCEPEELVDWCVDEKCSLCSLRKETLDSAASDGSVQSTPTEEVISQVEFNTENTECQAENYLNALFEKKDLPQNCDPNIPLVAQELMKKMIRQFAIEYVSKSRKMYPDNGMTDPPHGCNGIKLNQSESLLQEEQDSPLDLTITRIQERDFEDEDGALDLSLKRTSSRIQENYKIKNLKLGVLQKLGRKGKEGNSTLVKVLASYCLYHRQQLVLMLKFIREEQKTCSQTCHSHLQNHKPAKSNNKSPAAFFCCAEEQVSHTKQTPNASLPYPSVRLKDLRLTWPNLTLGTVKLNPIKDEDSHLTTSDHVLHCINTRSKKKKFFINFSNEYRLRSCSSFPRLKLQRVVVPLDRNVVECNLNYCIKPTSSSSVRNQFCQTTSREIKTGNESSHLNKSLCDIKKPSNLKLPATPERSQDKSKIGSVHFENVFKHLLNSSETNHFAKLLNQGVSNIKYTGVQTRFSSSRSFQSSSKHNQICKVFPKESTSSENDPWHSTGKAETAASKKKHLCDILIMNNSEGTQTMGTAWENKTKLPHCKLSMQSKHVSCFKMSLPCLPECSTLLDRRNVANQRKRCSRTNTFAENGITFKRYSKNILGKCKLCDDSHGSHSFPKNSNLFCKCTIKHNSGILMNLQPIGLLSRNITNKVKNAHLKVVVKRLEDTFWSGTKALGKSTGNDKVGKSLAHQGKLHDSHSEKPKPPVNRSAKQKNQTDSIVCSKLVTVNSSYGMAGNPHLYSPIKLMFASKVKTEDGIKYALSSVYTPSETNLSQEPSSHAQKTNYLNQSEGNFGEPNNIGQYDLRNISRRSRIKKTRSNYSQNGLPTKKNKTKQYNRDCVACFNFSDDWDKSSTTETYVAKNISSTQIKIQKLQKLPECNVQYAGNHNKKQLPQNNACKVSVRFTKRFQTLEKTVNSYGLCVRSDCNSKQAVQRKKGKPNVPQEKVGEANKLESCRSDQNLNPTSKAQKLTIPKFRLIRKKTVSDYFTRSRKSSLFALASFNAQSKFSPKCALLHKSKNLHFDRSKRYRRKLRSYKQQTKLPLLHSAYSEAQSPSSFTVGDLSSNPVLKWWCTTTSKETLINELEKRYEHIANTWVIENNIGKTQSSSTLKFSNSAISSPIQMLFKNKCDMNDLSTWFMQTTETKSLLVRRANAGKPFQIITKKGATKRTKQQTDNSSNNTECGQEKVSNAAEEPHRVSKFVSTETCSLKLRKEKCSNLNFKVLQSNNENLEVYQKRSYGNIPYVSEVRRHTRSSAKEAVQPAKKDGKHATACGTVEDSTLVVDTAPKRPHICKARIETVSENKQMSNNTLKALHCSNKESTTNCSVFVKKHGDRETNLLCMNEASAVSNRCTIKSCLRFNSNFSRTCSLIKGNTFDKPTSSVADGLSSKKCGSEMCLRNLKRTVVWFNDHCNAPLPKKRTRPIASSIETNKRNPRKLQPAPGKVQSDYPRLQIGPVKPVGFPTTRSLSSKYGSYSLTPIRISQSNQ